MCGCTVTGTPTAVPVEQAMTEANLEPGASSATAPSRLEVNVNFQSVGLPEINRDSVAKWARDVSAGDEATLVKKCWTVPPSYIRARYLRDRATLNSILGQHPSPGQTGISWGSLQSNGVLVTTAEGLSDYACPKVFVAGEPTNPDDYVAYRVKRFVLREQGRPVNPGDTESSYYLRCSYERGTITGLAAANPNSITVTASQSGSEWEATAGPVRLRVRAENGEPCVVSAR